MKKIFIGLIGLLGLIGLNGCDKIEPEEYTVYDGAVVNWMESTTTVEPVQRVYVEKFTGPRCSNCPLADVTLEGIHNDKVIMVSINHPTGQGTPYPNQPDMRTTGGNEWDKYFGINAIPTAFINRDRTLQFQGDMSNIVGAINQALTEEPIVAIDLHSTLKNNMVDVSAYMHFEKDYPDQVTLTVALVEDSLVYKQLLPDGSMDENYAHNHMLRKVVTSYWGTPLPIEVKKGDGLIGTLEFLLGNDFVPEHCHLVAIISDKNSRKVLNCASCEIEVVEE